MPYPDYTREEVEEWRSSNIANLLLTDTEALSRMKEDAEKVATARDEKARQERSDNQIPTSEAPTKTAPTSSVKVKKALIHHILKLSNTEQDFVYKVSQEEPSIDDCKYAAGLCAGAFAESSDDIGRVYKNVFEKLSGQKANQNEPGLSKEALLSALWFAQSVDDFCEYLLNNNLPYDAWQKAAEMAAHAFCTAEGDNDDFSQIHRYVLEYRK